MQLKYTYHETFLLLSPKVEIQRKIKAKKKKKGKKNYSEVKVLTQDHALRSTAETGRELSF